MAKLTARGHHEIARWSKVTPVTDEEHCDMYRREYVLRSDGKVLTSLKTHVKDSYRENPWHWHDYGWTIQAMKGTVNAETLQRYFLAHGYQRVS